MPAGCQHVAAARILPALLLSAGCVAVEQPYFPIFHIRPPAGHVNDPNGPFRDSRTGYVHLFMQYCPLGPCMNQAAPIAPGETPNYQSAAHFYSKDLVRWQYTGDSTGVIAGGKAEGPDDCPDDHGVYSGSTTVVNGTPYYAYPGVHLNPVPWTDGRRYPTMSQCVAFPADPADPTLSKWKKRTIIPARQIPRGISQHFHDDSTAFKGVDGRWWIFMGTKACPGSVKPSGDCPYPDPSAKDAHGVNFLFSSNDFFSWRPEHSLLNTSGFVSCPEFFTLPGMRENQYVYHSMGQKNMFGTFDPVAVTFTPDNRSVGKYDNADGHASKSYWDEQTSRRIMWSWIAGSFPCAGDAKKLPCDSMQSVPREMVYDAAVDTLVINPIAEVAELRSGQLADTRLASLDQTPSPVPGANGSALDVLVNFSCAPAASGRCSAGLQLRASGDGGRYIEVQFSGTLGAPELAISIVHGGTLERERSETVLNNTNLRGGDIHGDDYALPSDITEEAAIANCTAYCDSRQDCVGWTFVSKAPQGVGDGPRCAIKGHQTCQNPKTLACEGCLHLPNDGCGCISGTKRQIQPCGPGPSPGPAPHPDHGDGFEVPFAPGESFAGRFSLRVLVDTSVIEVYAQSGRAIGTYMYLPEDPADAGVNLRALGGSAPVSASIEVFKMGSAYAS